MRAYLTRLDSPRTGADAAHRMVVKGIGKVQKYMPLWRAEGNSLIVLSEQEPVGWRSTEHQTVNITDSIGDGQSFAFRLRANPVTNVIKKNGRKLSGRSPIIDEDEVYTWLVKRLDGAQLVDAGFTIEKPLIVPERKLCLHTVEFDGTLLITDQQAFLNTLLRGVGRSRTWGYGMLYGVSQ